MARSEKELTPIQRLAKTHAWGRILLDACMVFNRRLADHWRRFAGRPIDRRMAYRCAVELAREDAMYEAIHFEMEAMEGMADFRASESRRLELEMLRSRSGRKKVNDKKVNERPERPAPRPIEAVEPDILGIPFSSLCGNADPGTLDTPTVPDAPEMLYEKAVKGRGWMERRLMLFKDSVRKTLSSSSGRRKSLRKRALVYARPISSMPAEMRDGMPDFLTSEKMSERLCAMLSGILSSMHGGEFRSRITEDEKTAMAEYVYDEMLKAPMSYDFIQGCYSMDDQGMMSPRSFRDLEAKFYNGMYMTLSGIMHDSYREMSMARDRMLSIDEDRENRRKDDEGDGIIGDRIESSGHAPKWDGVGDPARRMWREVANRIRKKAGAIASELAGDSQMSLPGAPAADDPVKTAKAAIIRCMALIGAKMSSPDPKINIDRMVMVSFGDRAPSEIHRERVRMISESIRSEMAALATE